MKIKAVINTRYGGFGVSKKALLRLRELGQEDALKEELHEEWASYLYDICRIDPLLVQVVEELGGEANGQGSQLQVVEGEVEFEVDNYDGLESNPQMRGLLF